MRRAWKLARSAAARIGAKVKLHFANSLRSAWAEAKAAVACKRLIGHTEPFEGKTLKIVRIQSWVSKDGYDRRDYIQMEMDGEPKLNLAYFLRSGQADMLHGQSETEYGTIHYQENIDEILLA